MRRRDEDEDAEKASPLPASNQAMYAASQAWSVEKDDSSGKTYYYNETTGESTYQQPAGFVG